MMNLITFKILFFICIPIGIFLLVAGIKRVYRVFNSKVIVGTQMLVKSVSFEITKSGNYAIWIKAPIFRTNHLDKIKPKIYNQDNQKYIKLQYNFFSSQYTRSNNGSVGQMKLFTFKAEKGNYQLELVESSSLYLQFQKQIVGTVLKEADIAKCVIQVRENTPSFYGLSGVLLIVLGAGGSIAGFVLGLLTEKIWG